MSQVVKAFITTTSSKPITSSLSMLIISVLSFLHQRQVDERCHIQILLDSFGKRGLCNLGWWVVNGHTHSTYCWSFMVDFRLNLKETIVSNELERLK